MSLREGLLSRGAGGALSGFGSLSISTANSVAGGSDLCPSGITTGRDYAGVCTCVWGGGTLRRGRRQFVVALQ
jgi:hypothetical protein